MGPITTKANTRNRRAKVYDKKSLKAVKDQFMNRFKSGVDTLTGVIIRIPWHSIRAKELDIQRMYGQPVRGIHFHYGLQNNTFIPLVQFMIADDSAAGRGDLFRAGDHYELKASGALEVVDMDRVTDLTDEYKREIRIQRLDGPNTPPTPMKLQGNDPTSEWFAYADNVNALYNANYCLDPHLVISCISEPLCDEETISKEQGAAAALEEPYRHLLALHIGNGTADLLEDEDPAKPMKGLTDRALDLGHLCPPNCKRQV